MASEPAFTDEEAAEIRRQAILHLYAMVDAAILQTVAIGAVPVGVVLALDIDYIENGKGGMMLQYVQANQGSAVDLALRAATTIEMIESAGMEPAAALKVACDATYGPLPVFPSPDGLAAIRTHLGDLDVEKFNVVH